LGGEDLNPTTGISKKNEQYDPATNTWAIMADMPFEWFEHVASTANGKIYVFNEVTLEYTAPVMTRYYIHQKD